MATRTKQTSTNANCREPCTNNNYEGQGSKPKLSTPLKALLEANGQFSDDAESSSQPSCRPQDDEANPGKNRVHPQGSALLHSLLKANGLLTNDEAAAYIGVTPRTLEVWRCTKRNNIAYIKVGRLVKYRQKSLDDFLMSRTVEA